MIEQSPESASFNQAGYQQERLHYLFSQIDRLNAFPLHQSLIEGVNNYEIIFRNLVSCLLTISAKMTDKEKKDMNEKRVAIQNFLNYNPPKKKIRNYKGQLVNATCRSAFNELNSLLLDFRADIEMLMEKYGFGNPSKEKEEGWD